MKSLPGFSTVVTELLTPQHNPVEIIWEVEWAEEGDRTSPPKQRDVSAILSVYFLPVEDDLTSNRYVTEEELYKETGWDEETLAKILLTHYEKEMENV